VIEANLVEGQVELALPARDGGYGHRDHVKVHEVGKRAAELAGVATVLEATLPRELVGRLVRLARVLRLPLPLDPTALGAIYRPGAAITHRINVRRFARQKQAALACHHSVVHGPGGLAPVMRILVRLPAWVFGLLLGREWLVEAAMVPVTKPATAVFPWSVRPRSAPGRPTWCRPGP